jgi:hypothetical protein
MAGVVVPPSCLRRGGRGLASQLSRGMKSMRSSLQQQHSTLQHGSAKHASILRYSLQQQHSTKPDLTASQTTCRISIRVAYKDICQA